MPAQRLPSVQEIVVALPLRPPATRRLQRSRESPPCALRICEMSSYLYLDEDGSPVDANSLRRAELEARIKKYAKNCYCVALRNPDNPAESVACQNCLVRFQLEEHYQRRFGGKRPTSRSDEDSRRGVIELLEFVSVPTAILFFYRGLRSTEPSILLQRCSSGSP